MGNNRLDWVEVELRLQVVRRVEVDLWVAVDQRVEVELRWVEVGLLVEVDLWVEVVLRAEVDLRVDPCRVEPPQEEE